MSIRPATYTSITNTSICEGVRHERALFLSLFGTPDQREWTARSWRSANPSSTRGEDNDLTRADDWAPEEASA
jgi:hypothetical protein